jgi:hypothetical protein
MNISPNGGVVVETEPEADTLPIVPVTAPVVVAAPAPAEAVEETGLNILILLVFVAAVMGNLVTDFLASPAQVVAVALLAFVIFFVLVGTTTLLFCRIGCKRALALGMMVSQRNMGLMLAATAGVLPPKTWLYFAVSQFPIYLSPQLLSPIVRRLTTQKDVSAAANAGVP